MQVEQLLGFGPYRFDLGVEQVWRGKLAVKLTPKALVVLRTLVTRAGELVTKEELLQAGWPQTVVSDDALTTCIQELRRALGDDARQPRYIETVHRRGFRFIGKVVSCEQPVASGKEGASIRNGTLTPLPLVPDSEHSIPPLPPITDTPHPARALAGRERRLAQLQAWLGTLRGGWRRGALSLTGVAIIIATIVLVQDISLKSPRTPASVPPPPRPALTLPDKPSIAVLPFINMSGDREQEYFSDGITDDLITDLSGLPGLFVIARASTFTYKGKAAKPQDVGRELGVKYVLEGSVRKAAQQLRIAVQLVDAATGAELWAERYDRRLRDVFELQDEIVRRIVTTLNLQIALSQHGVVIPRSTDNLEAYDDVLRGWAYQLSWTKVGYPKARQMFEKAVELDPNYAYAYMSLGANYRFGYESGFDPEPGVAIERALHMEQQANALDDSFAPVHANLAVIYEIGGRHDRALAEAQRAIALDPNYTFGYETLATLMNHHGKPSEALAAEQKAARLDPRNPAFYLWQQGWAYNSLGRWEESISALNGFLANHPDFIWAHALLAIDYFNLGDHEAARAETAQVQRLIDLTPDSAMGYEALSLALWPIGKPVEAVAAAEKGISLDPQNADILAHLGIIYNQLGRWEKSLAALKRSLAFAPDNPWAPCAHALIADDYVALGEIDAVWAEAAEVERIVQRDPTADGYRALAETLNDLGKPAEALAALEKARRLAPNRVENLWTQGVSYTRLGRWQEAISALKGFLARYPDQVQPHVQLALSYIEVGWHDAARAEVAEALRLYPQFSLKMGVESESHLDNSAGEFNLDKERIAADLRKAGLK